MVLKAVENVSQEIVVVKETLIFVTNFVTSAAKVFATVAVVVIVLVVVVVVFVALDAAAQLVAVVSHTCK